jgi:hypothetical protein
MLNAYVQYEQLNNIYKALSELIFTEDSCKPGLFEEFSIYCLSRTI